MYCKSSEGQGSQFYLEISLDEKTEPELVYSHGAVSDEEKNHHNKDNVPKLTGHILLAEDTPDNQRLIRMYIKRTGAKVTIVENGEEALTAIQNDNYDLILMDMQMPVMDGLTAVKKLRRDGLSIPIVMLTANALQSDKDKCMAAGADDYLVKPIDLTNFYNLLSQHLSEPTSLPYSASEKRAVN